MLQHRMDMERIIVQAEARAAAVDPEKADKDIGGAFSTPPSGGSASKSGGGKTGRPRTAQFEGAVPGAGKTSAARQFGQQLGANALGLSGMGELPQ